MLRNLPDSGEQPVERLANTAYDLRVKAGDRKALRYRMSRSRIS
jgi:hypothetical protein